MIESVLSTTRIVGMVAVKDRAVEVAEPEDCFTIGCTARVQQGLEGAGWHNPTTDTGSRADPDP